MSTNVFNGPNAIKKIPSQAYLKSLFEYRDGVLYWKVKHSRKINAGQRAGSIRKDGYARIKIDGIGFFTHRLIYQLVHGDLEQSDVIDHWDGDRSNNKISNLRPCDQKSNIRKQKQSKDFPGICWHKVSSKWQAYYQDITGKPKTLGYYHNKFHAYNEVRNKMSAEYGQDYREPALELEDRHAYMDWLLDSQPDPAYDWMTT